MNRARTALLAFILGGLQSCAFGDRRISLTYDRPEGAHPSRSLSVLVEWPEDARSGPKALLGEVHSVLGVTTASVLADGDVGEWVHEALTAELRQAGFTIASAAGPPLFRVKTTIREISSEMGIGFRGRVALDLRVECGRKLILERTYAADDGHVLRSRTSGLGVEDSLRACLKRVLSLFVGDFTGAAERLGPPRIAPKVPPSF